MGDMREVLVGVAGGSSIVGGVGGQKKSPTGLSRALWGINKLLIYCRSIL